MKNIIYRKHLNIIEVLKFKFYQLKKYWKIYDLESFLC